MTNQQIRFFSTTLVFCVCISLGSISQNLEQSYLNTLNDEPLLTLFNKYHGDSIAQEKIARTYLDRARKQKDTIKMARGYDRLARIFHPKKNIAFADSVIEISKNQKHITYPAMGYILKAFELSSLNLSEGTQNYFKAYEIARLNRNLTQVLYIMEILIIRKSFWGNKDEALEMQRKSSRLLKQKNLKELLIKNSRSGYLNEIDNLVLQLKFNSNINFSICFINKREIDSAKFYYEKAKKVHLEYKSYLSQRQDEILMEVLNEIYYYSDSFKESVATSERILKLKENTNDYTSIYDTNYFKGLSLIKLQQKEKGVSCLLRADSIFEKRKIDILPYRREVFVELLNYYEEKNEYDKQIIYHKKISYCDSIIKRNLAFYESSIKKEIETPAILADKEILISELKKKSETPDTRFYIALAALTGTLCLLFFYVRKRLVYKKRFEKLLAQRTTKSASALDGNNSQNELSKEVVKDILEKLERFEQQHKYLDSDITLQKLAKKFKTNANYLSRVINLKLEKNFSQYLHDLRIGYTVEVLFTDTSCRKYTIKAIAEECGYKNAESFSKAFYKQHGIYPSYYLKKLEKNVG